MREIIIDTNQEGNNLIALLENGVLVEKYESNCEDKALEGNIYYGIVRNILPGMQSAFIDIGENRNGFIHIKDVIPKVSSIVGNREEPLSKYKISDFLQPNKHVLVQIKKDEENQKGARVSKHISLTGRLTVLMIDVDFITVSSKIEDKAERERVKDIAREVLRGKKGKYGLILRTAAEGKSKEEIEEDVEKLLELWKNIQKEYNRAIKENRPQLLFKNYDVLSKFLVGVLEKNLDRITVNNKDIYASVTSYLKNIKKSDVEVILKEDLKQINRLEKQVEDMKKSRIWLNCGGFIAIDKTEALTAIDVNSGKFTGNRKLCKEDVVSKVNKEATIEIAKQLRLRNISGIIIVDYIDMEDEEDRIAIVDLFNKELKKDRSKVQVVGFTKLDLLEITRKKL